jgi:phage terminase large subunit-like protein
MEEYCRHVKGPLAGRRFRLSRWQRELVRNLFGWKDRNGHRRYRFVWLEVPRKAGKTSLAAAIGLYMLLIDPEPAAEIVVAAGDSKQASILFDIARGMVLGDRDLSAVCKAYRRSIVYKDSYFQILSSNQETKCGANLSCLLFEEVQVQPSRDLHDTLITCMAARNQPLTVYIATAGWDRNSLAWELHDYAIKVRDGVIDDDTWLVIIYGAGRDDDWTNPRIWVRAHPGLGCTVAVATLERECHRAIATPGFLNSFRRHYLNIWLDNGSNWLDMAKWDACATSSVNPAALLGRECWVGLDLSTTTDLTALVAVFPEEDGGYSVLPFAFCPSERILERSRRDRVDYLVWRDQGHILATEGNVVDHAAIRHRILELADDYCIRELVFDRWNSSMLISQLMDDGVTCVPVSQGARSLNGAVRELERVVANRTLRHDGHPVLRWCAGNTVVEENAYGEVRPAKNRSADRIDLIVATLMPLSRFVGPGAARGLRPPNTLAAPTASRREPSVAAAGEA